MVEIQEKQLIGRLLYEPINDVFFEIVRFEKPYEFVEEYGRAMILKRLADDTEDCANWQQDIGGGFKLVSAEFPKELAARYSQLSKKSVLQNVRWNTSCLPPK